MERIKLERKQEQLRLHKKVQAEAERILESSVPANPDHPYLKRKGIKPHNLHQNQRDGLDVLLVEARDADGKLWNLQRIYSDQRERD